MASPGEREGSVDSGIVQSIDECRVRMRLGPEDLELLGEKREEAFSESGMPVVPETRAFTGEGWMFEDPKDRFFLEKKKNKAPETSVSAAEQVAKVNEKISKMPGTIPDGAKVFSQKVLKVDDRTSDESRPQKFVMTLLPTEKVSSQFQINSTV
jgi:hypothetical protein